MWFTWTACGIFLVLLFRCKISDLSIKTLWLVNTVPQQSHESLSVCWVHYINDFVSQFELFSHVFGHCRYNQWGLVFLCCKASCCNNRLILQSHNLVEIGVSHCKSLYHLELFVFIFSQNCELSIRVIGIFAEWQNCPNLSWHLPKST